MMLRVTGEMKMMMKKIGNNSENVTEGFHELYDKQIQFQKDVFDYEAGYEIDLKLPQDIKSQYQYHMLAMLEELGEVLKADKRWKTHRNQRYVKEEKLDEIADVFITAMNIAIYSGIESKSLLEEIGRKIQTNKERLGQEKCQL